MDAKNGKSIKIVLAICQRLKRIVIIAFTKIKKISVLFILAKTIHIGDIRIQRDYCISGVSDKELRECDTLGEMPNKCKREIIFALMEYFKSKHEEDLR